MRLGFDGRAFGEGAVSTIGDIVIALGSAALAPFASYIFERALVTVKTGPADGADGAFADLWTGRAAGAVVAGKQLIVQLADPAENLRVTALANQFAGTGGLEGPADLKGRFKPRAWGTCEGVPAILIDPAFGIYLLTETQATVSAVYDGGVAFAAGPAAADLAALQALAVPAGSVATSSSAAGTLVRPWTRPTFTMTADIVAGALTKPAEIAQAIVASRSSIAFAAGQVAAFDAAQPGPIGVFIDDERTLVEELDRIFAGLGAWWNLSLAGQIEIGRFAFGASAQSFAFEVADINRARILTPTRRRLVGYRRNFRPLTDSEIAGIIKAADLSGQIDWQSQIGGAGKPVDNATRNNVTSGTATPTGGVNGDLYYETDAQAWWSRIGGVWQKVSDATAANIAAGIAGQGALATLNSADWQTQVAGAGKPVDNATRNNVTSGTATPTGGVNGDLYYETDAQAWWSRIGGVWQKVSDATAANIAAGIAGQGALATLNSADWQTQVAGAGKPVDNATRNNVTSGTATPTGGVNGDLYYETDAQAWWSRIGGVWQKVSDATAANVAAGIAGQGALATLNSADWQTQVAGSGKPANNADVTGQNTALDTANVSGLTAGILRTSSRVGLFNGFEDGAEFAEWSVPAGNTLASDADAFSGGKAGLIGYAGAGDPASDVFTGGVYLTIPTEIALAFAGRRVRVTVFAKKPAANAASEFAVAYSTNETGNSGWIRFAPTTAWAAFSFLYVVPAPLFGGADFLGIWADTSNAGKKTLIDHVVIQAFPLDIEIDALGTTNGPQEAGANKTETRIAAGFTGQGALATQNAANFDSDVVDGVTFRRTTANEKTGAGRAFGALLSSTRIAVGVLKEQQSGGTPRELPIGGAENAVRDGVAVNFSQAWSGPPIIRFEGGVSYDPAFTGKQEQVFTPLNLSTTGYTPSLRVKAIGSSVPQNEGPFVDVGGTPRFQLEKNITAQDKNDTYVFNLSVNVTNCEAPPGEAQQGIIILGLYSRTVIGGGWTKRGVAALTSAGVHQASIIVDGLGIDAAFGVHVESFGPCGSTFTPAASSVSYDTGTTGGESSATPAGSADARGFLLGNQQGV